MKVEFCYLGNGIHFMAMIDRNKESTESRQHQSFVYKAI